MLILKIVKMNDFSGNIGYFAVENFLGCFVQHLINIGNSHTVPLRGVSAYKHSGARGSSHPPTSESVSGTQNVQSGWGIWYIYNKTDDCILRVEYSKFCKN